MSRITYNPITIGQAVDRVNRLANELNQTQESIERELKPHIDKWSGEGQKAYAILKADWDKKQAEIQLVLQQLAIAVKNANAGMANTDSHIARGFNNRAV